MAEARKFPDMWVDPENDPRPEGGQFVDEKAMLVEYLGYQRQTLQMKCDGLDSAGMATRSVACR